jgi:hypothetical protein
VTDADRRFRLAARAYLAYGIAYWIGGLYLLWHGVGAMGAAEGRGSGSLVFWALAGLVPLVTIPYLLHAPRAWFDRWVLSRRDFARVVAVLLAFRAYKVGQVALGDHGASVPAPWGGALSFRTGAAIFLVVTLAALAAIARAAWAGERTGEPREPARSVNA